MRFTTLIFDLDGTLLDTLADLHASVAHGLRTHGLAERSVAEVRAFLGNGIRNLIECSVPEGTDTPTLEAVFSDFRAHYLLHSLDTTQPYPGILELLERLRAAGVRMGIVSNKLDPAVQELNQRFFAHFMQVAVGESPGVAASRCCARSHAPTQCNAERNIVRRRQRSRLCHGTGGRYCLCVGALGIPRRTGTSRTGRRLLCSRTG